VSWALADAAAAPHSQLPERNNVVIEPEKPAPGSSIRYRLPARRLIGYGAADDLSLLRQKILSKVVDNKNGYLAAGQKRDRAATSGIGGMLREPASCGLSRL